MQKSMQGLEELARQSRVNYTTVKDTVYYDYFLNMASAEEELYQKWKELSLNGTDNPAKYRVWDYPIREQYTHVLQGTNLVKMEIFLLLRILREIEFQLSMILDPWTQQMLDLNL